MALSPGTRIGPYEVAALIGAGGMGEVYRATDTNLKRMVAIKVLPDSLASNTDRLARFQREAEVLASLNHPNIAQIHGLEKGPAAFDSAQTREAGHYTVGGATERSCLIADPGSHFIKPRERADLEQERRRVVLHARRSSEFAVRSPRSHRRTTWRRTERSS
jgi:hypothetical protein